ncbi:TonB-dependent siderophore receptor [Acinetobacter sp. B5B]|uniref:TonB-dependent receptor n=1 Tax=Acinetobacter baretiae TaxID=2605383 RepID=UPI0018C27054|nr:TonB-dependent siderophore receptor [Acinetobacter baretiae]MBF7683282.1 TonB-dependent siderophore receptor [Acinetobacter baretiae]
MTKKTVNKRTKTAKTVALAITLPNLAFASTSEITALPTIESSSLANSHYVKNSSSDKRAQPLLNTPRTTQIISEKSLKEQNLLSLQDALSKTPGVSFGAGEGGGGYGDKITLRGYDATANITADGLRDTALTTRSDLFNYEAVEITKGANSVENGAGQVSGGVNLVTKTPKDKDFNRLSVGLGTDDYTRFTSDFNKVINDDIAFRLNLMAHKNTYPERDESLKRWGIAPSLTFGIGDKTKATFSYLHQKDDNDPLYGVPYYNGRSLPGISNKNNYGYSDVDNIRITNDTGLLKVKSEVTDNIDFNSTTRLSKIHQIATVSAPQGTFCLANGLAPTAYTNTNSTGYIKCTTPGQYIVSGPRGFQRDTETKQIANDSNFKIKLSTEHITNAFIIGGGFSQEDYTLKSGGYLNNTNGSAIARPNMNVYNPNHTWNNSTNYIQTDSRTGSGSLDTYYGYIFNNTQLGSHWLIDLGARYDRTDGVYRNVNGAVTGSQNANLFSYSGGITFKPTPEISMYISYANSEKPTIGVASESCTSTAVNNTCNVKPETAVNYEAGVKWEANPDLLLTIAGFRNERNKVRVQGGDGFNYILDGKNYVNGIEAGLVGNITPKWEITASMAWMKGKYDQTAANGIQDFSKGDYITQVPEYSGNLWTTYKINNQWQIGYGATYQGEMYLSTRTSPANNKIAQVKSEDYLLHNASITYTMNKNLNFQLIGRNLSNKVYYTHIRNNGWAMPGEGRQTVLNINYNF